MGWWAKDYAAAVGRHPSAQHPHARSRSTRRERALTVRAPRATITGDIRASQKPIRVLERWRPMAATVEPHGHAIMSGHFVPTMPPPPKRHSKTHPVTRNLTPLATNRKLIAVISEIYCCRANTVSVLLVGSPRSRLEILRSTARKEAAHQPPLMSIS